MLEINIVLTEMRERAAKIPELNRSRLVEVKEIRQTNARWDSCCYCPRRSPKSWLLSYFSFFGLSGGVDLDRLGRDRISGRSGANDHP